MVHDVSRRVKVFDLSTGQELDSFDLPQLPGPDAQVSVTAQGRLRISGIFNKRWRLWELTPKTTESDLGRVEGESGVVHFSADGRVLAVAEGDTVKVWDVEKRRRLPVLKVPTNSTSPVKISLDVSDDGKTVATGGLHTPIALWETKTGKQLLKLNGRTNLAYKVAFSEDGTRLFSRGRTSWALRTGRVLRVNSQSQGPVAISTVAGAEKLAIVSPDARTQAGIGADNTIKISDIASGREVRALAGHTAKINSVAFSPDSTLIASAANDGSTFLWDATTGEHLLTLISLDDGGEWIVVTPPGLF